MRIVFFIMALTLSASSATSALSAENEKFVVYYSDKATGQQLKPFQLVVLDGTHHPALQPLKEDGKTLLGYISLGEVNQNSDSFTLLKSKNLILQENENWKGSFFVDLRDPAWARMVLEDFIPAVMRQGFDGIFIDTLDSPLELERVNPAKFKGMTEAAVHLIQAIRLQYPSIKIMMNRAYGILPKVAPWIDMELGESVYSAYDFNQKTYGTVDAGIYHQQVDILTEAKKVRPELKIYTLDYANPKDHKAINDIYKTERANGFIPYVATIGLDQLVNEPESP